MLVLQGVHAPSRPLGKRKATAATPASVAREGSRNRGRLVTSQAASNDILGQLPEPLAEPLVYSKAFMTVLARRVTEAALDAAAGISMQLAEQPQKMRDFADEVQEVAASERKGAGSQQKLLARSSSSSSSGAGGSSSSSTAGAPDLAAIVDELRADIAASRALLQQIKASSNSSTVTPSRR